MDYNVAWESQYAWQRSVLSACFSSFNLKLFLSHRKFRQILYTGSRINPVLIEISTESLKQLTNVCDHDWNIITFSLFMICFPPY